MVWNSEVGHHRFGMLTFLYDYVCDNRMVHGAPEVKALSIRHTKNGPERFAKEALPILRAYAESSVQEVEAELTRATRTQVGRTDEEIMEWLRRREFSKNESEKIIQLAKVEGGRRPHRLAAREWRHRPGAFHPACRQPGRLRAADQFLAPGCIAQGPSRSRGAVVL